MADTAGPEGAARPPGDLDGTAPGSSHETVSSLLDTLHVGVVMIDARGRVQLWSPAAEEILGWPPGRLAGRQVETLLAPTGADTPAELARGIYDTLRSDRTWRGVLHARHLEGHRVEIEIRAALLHDGHGTAYCVASIAETGRLRSIEQDLAALGALFDSSPLGIALFDTELRYLRVNEALARLNRLPVRDHVGRTVYETLPPDMAAEIQRLQNVVLRTGRPIVDMVTSAPDGGARSASYSRLTDDLGHVLGLSCTVMDVSERRHALAKIERARQRLALLDHVGVALGDLLDVPRIARALAYALVPRFADYAGVMLIGPLVHGGDLPATDPGAGTPLLQLGVAAKQRGPAVERMLRAGQDIAFEPRSHFGRTLSTGEPHLIESQEELRVATYPGDPKVQAALDLGVHSLLIAPLRARGIVLGLLVISRADGRDPFDRDDMTLTMDVADRAGTSLDNARLYAREREGALMLQRSLLPQRVPAPPGVGVAYRYVPGSTGTEVGGDWFDVIPLAGGRVAFVVGDVVGHGLRAAATMGRLRTAVRTLAGLDLPPDELLRRVNDLADDLAQGPDDPLMATCLYAVHDPSTRRCTLAKAGHLPPLLLRPRQGGGWHADAVELPSGAPLGVGGGGVETAAFESVELEVEEGAVLVLYTDGLVERRGEDITVGIERLRALLGAERPEPTLEDACDEVVATLLISEAPGTSRAPHPPGPSGSGRPPGSADDAALLMAKLGGLPEGSSASWTFSAGSYAVRRARAAVRDALLDWGLDAVVDEAVLLVSELVTNSLRYAHGPVGVRMVRGTSLLVEVSDPLPDPPRVRNATEEDEGGRGIQLVARESRRWGTRHGALGKTVWFELPLPG
ncbi:SpoIIE family protein phosphatase [Streptomyces sp. Z26]|uniref:SpoIIE family protein phosphatase n=1 Tax=Streptomyces sp. Z26 TaxID=2500177 RepID=UPI001F0CC9D6|nr:SpoIIE family protein phosphatase [Streptomyces sp. Z26]